MISALTASMTRVRLSRSRAFAREEAGSVAMIFGLMSLVLFTSVGAAVDLARMDSVKSRVANAADVAILAATQALSRDPGLKKTEVEAIAAAAFNANMESALSRGVTIQRLEVVKGTSKSERDIIVEATMPTFVMGVAGFDTMSIAVNRAAMFSDEKVELGVMLDVSGSMKGTKIEDLKSAAWKLVDTLIPADAKKPRVRIGWAPYNQYVNAGTFGEDATGVTSAQCVVERAGDKAFTDDKPTLYPFELPSGTWGGMACNAAPIVPLTSKRRVLEDGLDALVANGRTAGHLGIAWSWYLISDRWSTFWPAGSKPGPNVASKVRKIAVLMTDGKFNTQFIPGNGSSKTQGKALCDEMKKDNVLIYAVAFGASADEEVMKHCAELPTARPDGTTSLFYKASDGIALQAAFQDIADDIIRLRLTK